MSNYEQKRELQNEYRHLTGYGSPDGRWSVERLEKEIAAIKVRKAEEAQRIAEREAETARYNRAAELRIKRRGPIDQIKRGRGMSWKFWNTVRGAKSTVEHFEREREKFIESIRTNPGHALEWANGFFDNTADYETAMWIIDRFEHGVSEEEFFADVQRETLRRASDMFQSTSPTSNLMSNYRRKAFADIATHANW